MMQRLILIFVLFRGVCFGQEIKECNQPGNLEFGVRSSFGILTRDAVQGLGAGGHFRIQFLEKFNTEWFADWMTIDLKGSGNQHNMNIGSSLFFYPKKFGKLIPYFLAGYSFNYSKITPVSTTFVDRTDDVIKNWNSSVFLGAGTHYYLSSRFNLSLSAKYMGQFGEPLAYDLVELNGGHYLETQNPKPTTPNLNGSFMLILSLTYSIGNLW